MKFIEGQDPATAQELLDLSNTLGHTEALPVQAVSKEGFLVFDDVYAQWVLGRSGEAAEPRQEPQRQQRRRRSEPSKEAAHGD